MLANCQVRKEPVSVTGHGRRWVSEPFPLRCWAAISSFAGFLGVLTVNRV